MLLDLQLAFGNSTVTTFLDCSCCGEVVCCSRVLPTQLCLRIESPNLATPDFTVTMTKVFEADGIAWYFGAIPSVVGTCYCQWVQFRVRCTPAGDGFLIDYLFFTNVPYWRQDSIQFFNCLLNPPPFFGLSYLWTWGGPTSGPDLFGPLISSCTPIAATGTLYFSSSLYQPITQCVNYNVQPGVPATGANPIGTVTISEPPCGVAEGGSPMRLAMPLARPDRCAFLGTRTENRPGCPSGMRCRHDCQKGLPAVPGEFCQECSEYVAEEGEPWV